VGERKVKSVRRCPSLKKDSLRVFGERPRTCARRLLKRGSTVGAEAPFTVLGLKQQKPHQGVNYGGGGGPFLLDVGQKRNFSEAQRVGGGCESIRTKKKGGGGKRDFYQNQEHEIPRTGKGENGGTGERDLPLVAKGGGAEFISGGP